jgi:short chain dehydrogenase
MLVTRYFANDLYKDKTVFVTGGGSGINLGVAKNFAALGANIAICGRTQEKLDAAAVEMRALGAKVCPVAADVRDIAARPAKHPICRMNVRYLVTVDGRNWTRQDAPLPGGRLPIWVISGSLVPPCPRPLCP